jgi:hypothetical protein
MISDWARMRVTLVLEVVSQVHDTIHDILREEYGLGDRMLGEDGLDQKVDEMEKFLPPSIVFVFLPALLSLFGILILTQLPWLIGQYNYLRGASSPIDQSTLVLLGSDLARLAVLTSSIIGMMIGLFLVRFVTRKLDVVRKEGKAELGARMYFALFVWWMLLSLPYDAISLLDSVVYGPSSSHFLSDLRWFTNAGYFLAFAIPVLLKYVLLVLHAKSIDSRVILIGLRSGSRFKRRFQYLTLGVTPSGPDP